MKERHSGHQTQWAAQFAVARAFSGKVDTGFPQKMRPLKESGALFRFNLIGTRSSELCKRKCQVALTLGNHPLFDLMVVGPNGKSFKVDVKGLYKRKRTIGKRGSESRTVGLYLCVCIRARCRAESHRTKPLLCDHAKKINELN
jgi:hypothetical protein